MGLMTQVRDVMIVYATPLGSSRRMAHPDGSPVPINGAAPTLSSWLELAPNNAYDDISSFTMAWPGNGSIPVAVANMQAVLNVTPRHEPPRRLQVAAKNIRLGAVLEVKLDGLICAGGYDIRLPIYPTHSFDGENRIWTTAVEAGPLVYYTWMSAVSNQHGIRVVNQDGTSTCQEAVPMHFNDFP